MSGQKPVIISRDFHPEVNYMKKNVHTETMKPELKTGNEK